ncbi:MAG: DUF4265 domain-containing protein [Proteobacteria bacterium]|nr:DUF4265 domain-containing protein [Pseudomonadota bacterium]NOG60887.1 DUF4265 domain-containing protein [Pseudomonadota bacterium]
MNDEELEKVHIDLPNHWAIGGESLWATPLGNNLYRIENIPFFAYGLNFQDIVLATPDSEDLKPEIRKVITPGEHRTYRIIFNKEVDRQKQEVLLNSLKQYKTTYERANGTNVAVDIEPTGDHIAVYDQLENYEESELLSFETCEARIEGSFDDAPEVDESA